MLANAAIFLCSSKKDKEMLSFDSNWQLPELNWEGQKVNVVGIDPTVEYDLWVEAHKKRHKELFSTPPQRVGKLQEKLAPPELKYLQKVQDSYHHSVFNPERATVTPRLGKDNINDPLRVPRVPASTRTHVSAHNVKHTSCNLRDRSDRSRTSESDHHLSHAPQSETSTYAGHRSQGAGTSTPDIKVTI